MHETSTFDLLSTIEATVSAAIVAPCGPLCDIRKGLLNCAGAAAFRAAATRLGPAFMDSNCVLLRFTC
jgi:hypothetical protein